MSEYCLYGVECSYYAAKIRAYLQFKQIAFHETQASRRVYAQTILPRVGWPVVPVLVTPDDVTLQDTSDMFDALEARHPTPAALPARAAARVLSYLLEFLGDEWLKLPAMHYRWNYNYEFIVAEFGRNNDPDLPAAKQREIGHKIAPRFHGWLPHLGVTPRTAAQIESDYLALLRLFDQHLQACPYLLGGAPTLGDFAFFGPLYAHLDRDPVSGAILRRQAPRVGQWIDRLRAGCTDAVALDAAAALPPSLLPVLRLLLRDFVPIVVAEIEHVQRWLADHSDLDELPRHCGEHRVVFGRGSSTAITETRALFPYNQWMLQRLHDAFKAAPAADQNETLALFEQIGARALLAIPLRLRVVRRDFRLRRAA